MFPLKYENIYMSPESGDHVKAPEDFELSSNTHFPNLNSRDYAKQPLNHTNRMYDVWECIDRSVPNGNCSENVVICCNKNSGRDFKSSAWGFYLEDLVCGIEASENPVKEENACFKLQCDDLITHMVYVSPTNVSILNTIVLLLKHLKFFENLSSVSFGFKQRRLAVVVYVHFDYSSKEKFLLFISYGGEDTTRSTDHFDLQMPK